MTRKQNEDLKAAENDEKGEAAKGPKTLHSKLVVDVAHPLLHATADLAKEGKNKLSKTPSAIYQRERRAVMKPDQHTAHKKKSTKRKKAWRAARLAAMSPEEIVEKR